MAEWKDVEVGDWVEFTRLGDQPDMGGKVKKYCGTVRHTGPIIVSVDPQWATKVNYGDTLLAHRKGDHNDA